MGTDSSMGGKGSLRAPLNLAVIGPVGIPYIDSRGVNKVGMSPPWGWGTGKEALASWAVGFETTAVGTCLHLLVRGGPTDVEGSGQVMVPQRMSYRPLASDLASANSTCWRPLVILPCTTEN